MNSIKDGEILLLNDSFPPLIDGVANTVMNYGRVLKERGYQVAVATPEYPGADDSAYPYQVLRYPSLNTEKLFGYRAGLPLDLGTQFKMKEHQFSLVHSHCPAMSNLLAKSIVEKANVPFILTYHSRFDMDFARMVKGKLLLDGMEKALVRSVSMADEVWAVSRGAGESIRQMGYEGDIVVMENGVDMPKRRATGPEIESATKGYDLPQGVPVFLFVGRMMWYKGVRFILEALAALKSQHLDFRMVFIGKGADQEEMQAYAKKLQLADKCFFTGAIYDRTVLQAWYSRADLFLFPSTYDTNGLVVREAAASGLGTVMIKDSCASEGVTDQVDGLLVEENSASLAVCLARIIDHKDAMREIGQNAEKNLYISWETSVEKAMERYEIVLDNYQSGKYQKKRHPADDLFTMYANMVELFNKGRLEIEAFKDERPW